MDSLGGILTNGLLGNPVLASFNLTLFKFLEIEVQQLKGHSHGATDYREEITNRVIFKISLFKNTYHKSFDISDNKINIVTKILKSVIKLKNYLLNIKLRKEIKVDTIKVKINAKD